MDAFPATSVWQQTGSTVGASKSKFLCDTKRSMLTTDTSDRADIGRVRDALKVGDIRTINDLLERDRANPKIQIDQTTGGAIGSKLKEVLANFF